MRELTVRKVGIEAIALMTVIVLLTVIGPFGTFVHLSFADRIVYWTIAILGGTFVWHLIWLLVALVPPARRWPLWAQVVAGAALTSGLLTFGIIALEGAFRPGLHDRLPGYAELYFYVASITLVISGLVSHLLFRPTRSGATEASSAAERPFRPPAFSRRIPGRLGAELLALQTEDHYLRIHTKLGSDLVLCRLSDALAELEGVDGLQVHRSWWVARSAVEAVEREGQKTRLRLVNGLSVSVSRTYLPAVRAAGWVN
jgi:hypothetical protein